MTNNKKTADAIIARMRAEEARRKAAAANVWGAEYAPDDN